MKTKWIEIELFFFLFIMALVDLCIGTTNIPIQKILQYITFQLNTSDVSFTLLHKIRYPRILAATAAGIAISVSGILMQTFFKNPLAGPYVMGISAGSSLGVALFIMAFPVLQLFFNEHFLSFGISGFAIFGAVIFMLIIYFISLRLNQSLTVLIAGILLGTAANALINLLQYSAGTMELKSFVLWNMGNIYNTSALTSWVVIIAGIFSLFILLIFSKRFDIWLLGEEQAFSLGINKKQFTFIVFFITSILTGLVTAFYGPIAFIGLISPHIGRILIKTNVHAKLFIVTASIGMILMLLSDIIVQLIALISSGSLVPLNTITSLIAIPLLTYLFIKKKELWM